VQGLSLIAADDVDLLANPKAFFQQSAQQRIAAGRITRFELIEICSTHDYA
jgi:hypothetical protein